METGRFPMKVDAQCRNFKFWLSLIKKDNKLSQITYDDIKWNENKALCSKKIRSTLYQIGLGEFSIKAHYMHGFNRNCRHNKAKAERYRTPTLDE